MGWSVGQSFGGLVSKSVSGSVRGLVSHWVDCSGGEWSYSVNGSLGRSLCCSACGLVSGLVWFFSQWIGWSVIGKSVNQTIGGSSGRSASGLGIWRVSGWVVPSVVVSKWSIVWSVDLSVINPDSWWIRQSVGQSLVGQSVDGLVSYKVGQSISLVMVGQSVDWSSFLQ